MPEQFTQYSQLDWRLNGSPLSVTVVSASAVPESAGSAAVVGSYQWSITE
jgi:hypothetical protein